MKSQQVKCLLSACNPLFFFTSCSALINVTVCLKSLSQRKHVLLSVRSIYIPFKLVEDPNSTALSDVK